MAIKMWETPIEFVPLAKFKSTNIVLTPFSHYNNVGLLINKIKIE